MHCTCVTVLQRFDLQVHCNTHELQLQLEIEIHVDIKLLLVALVMMIIRAKPEGLSISKTQWHFPNFPHCDCDLCLDAAS